MVEGEQKKPEEKPISLLEQLSKSYLENNNQNFSKYTQDVQNFGHVPLNQFDHAWGLIKSQKRDIHKERFNYLNDPMIYLGNIENEKTLSFYQNDIRFLGIMDSMALTDPVIAHIFEPLFEIFKIELRLTGNLGNAERHLQAFQIPVSSDRKGFKIFGRRKKKKPVDYVLPEEEEMQEGMY